MRGTHVCQRPGRGGRFKWLEPQEHLPRPGGSRAAASSGVCPGRDSKRGFASGLGVTAFGGYTRPAKEAHRGGGSPRLEGQTGLHCPPHKGKSRPQLVAPDARSVYPAPRRHSPSRSGRRTARVPTRLRGRRGVAAKGAGRAALESVARGGGARGRKPPGGRQEAPPPRWPRPAGGRKPLHRRPVCDAARRPTRLQPLPVSAAELERDT